MSSKPPISAAVSAAFLLFALHTDSGAQAPPPKPAAPVANPTGWVSPAVLEKIYGEAETAFTDKQYDTAITKIKELLKAIGPNKEGMPIELLYFNIGLAHLLANKASEAEIAFLECIKIYPRGELTSRCHLGAGRAFMLQDPPEKKQRAIEELTLAYQDPKFRAEAGLWLGV